MLSHAPPKNGISLLDPRPKNSKNKKISIKETPIYGHDMPKTRHFVYPTPIYGGVLQTLAHAVY